MLPLDIHEVEVAAHALRPDRDEPVPVWMHRPELEFLLDEIAPLQQTMLCSQDELVGLLVQGAHVLAVRQPDGSYFVRYGKD